MPSAIDLLSASLRSSLSFLSRLRPGTARARSRESPADLLIYRLKRWPKLRSASMSTDICRALSIMSTRPVNRRWIMKNCGLELHEVDRLLQALVDQDAVEVTDSAKYRPTAA